MVETDRYLGVINNGPDADVRVILPQMAAEIINATKEGRLSFHGSTSIGEDGGELRLITASGEVVATATEVKVLTGGEDEQSRPLDAREARLLAYTFLSYLRDAQ